MQRNLKTGHGCSRFARTAGDDCLSLSKAFQDTFRFCASVRWVSFVLSCTISAALFITRVDYKTYIVGDVVLGLVFQMLRIKPFISNTTILEKFFFCMSICCCMRPKSKAIHTNSKELMSYWLRVYQKRPVKLLSHINDMILTAVHQLRSLY